MLVLCDKRFRSAIVPAEASTETRADFCWRFVFFFHVFPHHLWLPPNFYFRLCFQAYQIFFFRLTTKRPATEISFIQYEKQKTMAKFWPKNRWKIFLWQNYFETSRVSTYFSANSITKKSRWSSNAGRLLAALLQMTHYLLHWLFSTQTFLAATCVFLQ